MEAEFNSLEAKVEQFVALCERLRAENSELRAQLAAAQRDAKLLNEKIDGREFFIRTVEIVDKHNEPIIMALTQNTSCPVKPPLASASTTGNDVRQFEVTS